MNSYDKYDMMSEDEQWRYVEGISNRKVDLLKYDMNIEVNGSIIPEDHFTLTMNGYMLGTFSRDQLTYMIEQIHNQINTES